MSGQVIQGFYPPGARALHPSHVSAVQRKALPNGFAFALPRHLAGLPESGGTALQPELRQAMESFFGAGFADVRVHVGAQPAALGALAFTRGSHLHFAPGHFSSASPQGLQILGHELAHVVQQRAGRVRNPFGQGIAVVHDALLEAEADRLGHRAAAHVLQQRTARRILPPSAVQPYFSYRNKKLALHSKGVRSVRAFLAAEHEGLVDEFLDAARHKTDDNGTLNAWLKGKGFKEKVDDLIETYGEVKTKAPKRKRTVVVEEDEEEEEAPKKKKKAKRLRIPGRTAADGIIQWLNSNGYGGDSNFTVGVTVNGNLILSKVNGITAEAKAMKELKPVIEEEGWHVDRYIYLAQKFNTAVGSNHAEMCILAAIGRGNLTYMKCTNPNCDFCAAALKTYNVPSGNSGGGKSQQGWTHPFYPIFYGTQIGGVKAQVTELKGLGQDPEKKQIKLGTWGVSLPSGGKYTQWIDG
jgi:hypothetical protein